MLDYLQEADNTMSLDDFKNLPSVTCKTRFGPKSDHGMATSSAGSMTPRSPLTTPRSNHIDMLLAGKNAINESDDLPQVRDTVAIFCLSLLSFFRELSLLSLCHLTSHYKFIIFLANIVGQSPPAINLSFDA
jgi:hypothetical protein